MKWKKLYGSKLNFVCPYCLKTLPLSVATVEHEPPRSRAKELGVEPQTYLTCARCNNEKGALTLEEYNQWKRLELIRNGNTKER